MWHKAGLLEHTKQQFKISIINVLLLLSHFSCVWLSDSVQPHRQQPTSLLRPWDSPGKNTGVGRHFLLQCMKVKSESEVAQSCPTLCDPTDCSLPGSSIHGIFQARVLEWVAIAFSNNVLKDKAKWGKNLKSYKGWHENIRNNKYKH